MYSLKWINLKMASSILRQLCLGRNILIWTNVFIYGKSAYQTAKKRLKKRLSVHHLSDGPGYDFFFMKPLFVHVIFGQTPTLRPVFIQCVMDDEKRRKKSWQVGLTTDPANRYSYIECKDQSLSNVGSTVPGKAEFAGLHVILFSFHQNE